MMTAHKCFTVGNNLYGQQGQGTDEHITKLIELPLPKNIKITNIISGRNGSTYLLLHNNQMIVLGHNEYGQLGTTTELILVIIRYWCRYNLIINDIIKWTSFAYSYNDKEHLGENLK